MTLNLEPIKARLAAATPTKWQRNTHNEIISLVEDNYHWLGEMHRYEDATFVENAPTDIAALITGVERYEKLYNQVNTANELNRKDADNYKSLINKIKAVCEQSNNSDGAYIKRLIEEMEGDGNADSKQ